MLASRQKKKSLDKKDKYAKYEELKIAGDRSPHRTGRSHPCRRDAPLPPKATRPPLVIATAVASVHALSLLHLLFCVEVRLPRVCACAWYRLELRRGVGFPCGCDFRSRRAPRHLGTTPRTWRRPAISVGQISHAIMVTRNNKLGKSTSEDMGACCEKDALRTARRFLEADVSGLGRLTGLAGLAAFVGGASTDPGARLSPMNGIASPR